ncbi:MAG: hypothetical protein Q4F95_02560 [Oscillospiraceae bacterium]|nr:hypothetical protein [Oscillospiraceae bacterium]
MIINEPSCSYINGKIHVIMDYELSNQYTQYAFYLYNKDNKIVEKVMYSKLNHCCFNISEEKNYTFYFVKAFIRYKYSDHDEYKKESVNSKRIMIYAQEVEKEYLSFISKCSEKPKIELPFWRTQYPYQDIVIGYDISGESNIKEVLSNLSKKLDCHVICSDKITIAATQNTNSLDKKLIAFSGISRNDESLIFGYKDENKLNDPEELYGQIGNFFAVFNKKGIFTIRTDYFGMSKVYYYKDNSVLLISNRYHMLLIAMSSFNIAKSINYEKVYAYLSKNNQLMMQNFSRELNIEDTFVLPVDSMILIDTNRNLISIEKTSLYYDLSSKIKYSEELYDTMLREAADEIVDNVGVALNSRHFDNFIVDVTGGLDSRICFCALSKFPQYKDRIIPHTACGATYEEDFDIAMKILSKSPFEFRRPDVIVDKKRDVDAEAMSYILGTSSEYSKFPVPYRKSLCFPGFCGEVTGRPYYASHYVDSQLNDSFISSKKFFKLLSKSQGHMVYDADSKVSSYLYDECSQLPGESNMEKFENHYLYYRNGIHFNDSWRSSIMCSCWSVLQSKKMLKLKYMLFPNDNIKLQLDILYLLNPEIAAIEFNKEYNLARKKLNDKYGTYPVNNTFDTDKIEKLKSLYNKNKIRQKNEKIEEFKKIYSNDNVLSILNILVNKYGFDKEIGFMLYCYIKYNTADTKRDCLLIKLCSLYFEIS